ncbi:hypothetical protein AB0K05_25260 [Nonomuraea sp. NPDC049486]
MFIIGVPSRPQLILDSDLYAPALDDLQVWETLGITTRMISQAPDRSWA